MTRWRLRPRGSGAGSRAAEQGSSRDRDPSQGSSSEDNFGCGILSRDAAEEIPKANQREATGLFVTLGLSIPFFSSHSIKNKAACSPAAGSPKCVGITVGKGAVESNCGPAALVSLLFLPEGQKEEVGHRWAGTFWGHPIEGTFPTDGTLWSVAVLQTQGRKEKG